MYFNITMFWFMLNIFLMISAISQVRGLNKNSSKISNSFHQTKNEPSVLILQDGQGNKYKYIYPNDMDQFSKMSTLGNKNSSTVIHLPPGILKSETSDSPVDHSYIRLRSATTERSRTTNPKNSINEHKQSLPGSKDSHLMMSSVFPTPTRGGQHEKENTAILIKENESTETTTLKDCKTEKEEDGNETDDKTALKPIDEINYSKEILNNTPILSSIINNEKYETLNKPQNLYKSCDTRNGLILLVKNDIKLKLFLKSNGILDKLSPVNSRKNSTIKLKDELSSEEDVMYQVPNTVIHAEE